MVVFLKVGVMDQNCVLLALLLLMDKNPDTLSSPPTPMESFKCACLIGSAEISISAVSSPFLSCGCPDGF